MAERLLAWRGVDPDRVDTAAVRLDGSSLSALGTSTSSDGVVDYRLRTGPDWVTRALDVRVRDESTDRRLRLNRDETGTWTARRAAGDEPLGLPEPLDALQGAQDCDLAHCPLTNTMPIRRLGLLAAAGQGEAVPASLLMAWVDLPDLTVHPSRQTYAASYAVDPAGAVIDFASGEFRTAIEVDADGFVVSYPGVAYRVPA